MPRSGVAGPSARVCLRCLCVLVQLAASAQSAASLQLVPFQSAIPSMAPWSILKNRASAAAAQCESPYAFLWPTGWQQLLNAVLGAHNQALVHPTGVSSPESQLLTAPLSIPTKCTLLQVGSWPPGSKHLPVI